MKLIRLNIILKTYLDSEAKQIQQTRNILKSSFEGSASWDICMAIL